MGYFANMDGGFSMTQEEKPSKAVIAGFCFLVTGYVVMLIIFISAMFSPAKTVVIRIDAYYEAYIEAVLIVLSFFCVPAFIREVVRKRIVIPFWMRKAGRK